MGQICRELLLESGTKSNVLIPYITHMKDTLQVYGKKKIAARANSHCKNSLKSL